jgi:class 3 adenylate cyclase
VQKSGPDRATRVKRELCCITVLDKPSKQVGYPSMASTRRLTAILAADVAGYSRLMGADEEGTLAALKAVWRELSDPKIKEHHGRIVKTTGDGLLVEFGSVVDAVRCAVEVQREMAMRNTAIPAERRIEFRIGINLGDIIKDKGDIYGDGVNVAARLEARAGSASAAWCATRCATNSISPSRTGASSRSKTSPVRSASSMSGSPPKPRRRRRIRRRRCHRHRPTSRRSRSCRSRT